MLSLKSQREIVQVESPRWLGCRFRPLFSPPSLGLLSRPSLSARVSIWFVHGARIQMDPGKEEANRLTESPSAPKHPYKDPDDGRQRFLLELEFVQCLANPAYIHYLAQNRYFEDDAFIGYLKYLQYWQRPEYIKYIMYPHCLFFLELLQNANFRSAMAHPGSKELAHRQQYFFWKNYRSNRLKHIVPRPLPEPAAPPPPTPPAPMPPMAAASAPALSPMQVVAQPGSALPKVDMRNNMAERRKRKKEG